MNQTETNLGYSIEANIEQLEGGYISNIEGRRKIYKDAHGIDDVIRFKHILGNMKDGEYIFKVDLIPKGEYVATVRGEEMITSNLIVYKNDGSDLSIYEQAKLAGIIQPAEAFDPEPAKPIVNTATPITVTTANCYSIDKLKSIDWIKYDKEFPLTSREKADIAGIVGSTMYNLWNKVEAGTFQWQSINTRIGMTILAQYYEKRSEKKEKREGIPPRNDTRLMEIVREIELMCKGGMVKSNLILKKTEQFKKLLIEN